MIDLQHTKYYNLPLWELSDVQPLLESVNDGNHKVDETLGNLRTDADDLFRTTRTLGEKISENTENITALKNASAVTNENLTKLSVQVKTNTDDISDLKTSTGTTNTNLSNLSAQVETNTDNIKQLSNELDTQITDFKRLSNSITSFCHKRLK